MLDVKMPNKGRYLLWRDAFQRMTKLDRFSLTEINRVTNTKYVHWNGTNPTFVKSMCTWGEAEVSCMIAR